MTPDCYMPCHDCGHDTSLLGLNEYYMIADDLWFEAIEAVPPDGTVVRYLCIGCLETRLGFALRGGDFTDALINEGWIFGLRHRRSLRFRDRLRR